MIEEATITDLKFDPANARVPTVRGEAVLAESIAKVGMARSVVIDESNTLLAGNSTVEQAGQAGITKVLIVTVEGDTIVAVRREHLTSQQKKQLSYYDNRAGELGQWNPQQIALDAPLVHLPDLWTEKELAKLATEPVTLPASTVKATTMGKTQVCPHCGQSFTI